MATPLEVVDLALRAVTRPDLVARLTAARDRLADDAVRVLVVGEFKQGKSMLVNCLVGAPVCPVADDIATAVPTVIRHAEQLGVTVVRGTERFEIDPVELAAQVCEGGESGVTRVEVGLPRSVLAGGLELVDTPGVGGLSSAHGAATMAALPSADAVLLVSDASQEYTGPELEFLARAAAVCPNVACVLTKTDLYPEWRRIAELDRAHLARAGITAEQFAVSSMLRWEAVLGNDGELNEESGYPPLVRYLRSNVLGQADRLARRSVIHDVAAVTGQVAASLRAEYEAQQNPQDAAELVARLKAARQRAADLKERAARWQQTLADGVADLNADIDHDLRGRMREIVRVAEEEIEQGGDPTPNWERFTRWVQDEVASAASANFVWATQRVRSLGERVAGHFSDDHDQMVPALRADPSDVLSTARPPTLRRDSGWTLGAKALTGVRGGYMGVLMVGMLGTIVGLSLLNPFSLGAGLALGGKAIGDERKRIVAKRQGEARAAVKRYVDDITFALGKESRDRLRGVQRDLRDHFTGLAEQLRRSMQESLQAAERAVSASTAEKEKRLPEIKAELARLEAVRVAARGLLPRPSSA